MNKKIAFPRLRTDTWMLLGILILAISLRLWGINFGLPYLYHPDEPPYVAIAQDIFKSGDLNPRFLNYPSLFFYLNALVYIPYFVAGKLAGLFQVPSDIPAPSMLAMGTGLTLMPSTFLLGRLLTATFGIGSVALVFLLGRQLTSSTMAASLAALMMAISPSNVANSRFITPDTFLVFFAMLSLWGAVKVFQQGKLSHYLLTGVAVGLTISTKYNGALIVLPLLAAHFIRHRLGGLRHPRLYMGLGLGAATFFLTTPFALLDYQRFLTDFQFEAGHYSTGHPGMEGNTLGWYLSYLWQVEGLATLLAALGVVWGLYTRRRELILLSIFPVFYFAFINSFAVRNDRTLLPLTPFLFLLASSLLVGLFRRSSAGHPNPRRWLRLVAVALALASLAWPAMQTVKNNLQLTTVDSRETARIWIEDHVPSGARIAIESYAPYVDPQRFSVQAFGKMIDHTPEWYRANGFDMLVFSQGMFARFFEEPERYSNEVSQYEDLFQAFDLVRAFSDGGYEVRVYRAI
ncbi:MAG: phospholipid carrier-dependent glycosyltransferase [Chloroflexota bacterium]